LASPAPPVTVGRGAVPGGGAGEGLRGVVISVDNPAQLGDPRPPLKKTAPTTDLATLSVLVTSYEIPDLVEQALISLEPLRARGAEVVVADCGSDELTPRVCADRGVSFHRFENRGYSALINSALPHCQGDTILLLNGDTELLDTARIDGALAFLGERTDVGAVGLRHVGLDGKWQLSSWSRRPSILSEFRRKLTTKYLSRWPVVSRWIERRGRGWREVAWVSGSAILAPRECFLGDNAWDERFFLYFEDLDWCLRLARMGHRIVYYPSLGVRHAGGASTGQLSGQARRHYDESQLLFFDRHGSPFTCRIIAILRGLRGRPSST
jgi:GT2 family glycosyltransferase